MFILKTQESDARSTITRRTKARDFPPVYLLPTTHLHRSQCSGKSNKVIIICLFQISSVVLRTFPEK